MIKNCTVIYYISPSGDNPISDFIDLLTEKQQAKVLRIFLYIKEYGLSAIQQHTKKLTGTPLWEIRILGKDNIRVLYILATEKTVLVLHGFIKKSQKTPGKELKIALTRYVEWHKR